MAIKLENKINVDGASGSFPYGKIRDKTSTTAGTPVNTSVYGDFHQFFARILDKSGVIANGLLENLTNGFQYFESILKLGFKYNSDPIVRGLIGSYTTGDLIILHGIEITVAGNVATWTEGAVYYNKKNYLVSAGTVTRAALQTFVFAIEKEEESVISIIAGPSLSGIANYNAATVKYFSETTNYQGGPSSDIIQSISVPIGCTGGIQGAVFVGDYGVVFQKTGSTMNASGVLYIDVPDASANINFGSESGISIGFINLELTTKYKGKHIAGASFVGGVNQGVAVCTNNSPAGNADIGFGNSSLGKVRIDENGNLSINNISPPGANKRVVIQFNLQYELLN
jgi:hypothetical protein